MKHLIILILFVTSLFSNINKDTNSLFTQEELDWIRKNPIVKIGVDANWPPFEYVNEKGEYKGIASDYLEIISKYTGLKFEINASDWYSVISNIKDKKLDMLACVAKTPDRENYLNYTSPFLTIDVVVIAKKDLKIQSFDEIQNYTIAVQKGNFVYEKISKKYPNAKFVFASSNKEAFDLVSYGKADIFIGNMPVFSYFVEKEMYTNIEVKFKADFDKIDLSMAVLKENETLFNIIQKVMPKIIEDEKEKINKKWIFELKEEKSAHLTKEEINWIKENPKIKISGDFFWPPYSFYDENGNYIGIIPDIVNEVFKSSGLELEYVKTNSWADTINLIKDKKINLIDAISYSSSRGEYLNFSNKYIGAEIVIISNNKETNYINSFNNITDKKIATVKGYFEVKTKKIPIIFLSGKDSSQDIEQAYECGGIDYVVKPFITIELITKVNSYVRLKQLEDKFEKIKG